MSELKSHTQLTYLPMFNGFYGDAFGDPMEELHYDISYFFDNLNIELEDRLLNKIRDSLIGLPSSDKAIEDWEKSICEQATFLVESAVKEVFPIKLTFKDINRPREYNFRNDHPEVEMEFDPEALRTFLFETRREEFSDFVKENCASYDGFASFYLTSIKAWENSFDEYINNYAATHIMLWFLTSLKYTIDELTDAIRYSDIYIMWGYHEKDIVEALTADPDDEDAVAMAATFQNALVRGDSRQVTLSEIDTI